MAWAQLRFDEVRVKRSESSEGDYAYLGHWEVQRREKVLHVLLAQLFTKNRANGRTQERKVHGVRLIHDILGIFLFSSGLFDTLESGLGLFVGLLCLLLLEFSLLSCLLTLEGGLLTFEGGHQRIIALFSCVHDFLGKLPDFFFQGLGLFK